MKRLPKLCQQCITLHSESTHCECNLCRDMEFYEDTLCELNRLAQSSKGFQCHAFKSELEAVRPLARRLKLFSKDQNDKPHSGGLEELLGSDRFKYRTALAKQRLEEAPDTVFVELTYHLAWNVAARMPIFEHSNDDIDIFDSIFATCGSPVGCSIGLLWLAPDHIHLYVKSDGEYSIDKIAAEIKRSSAITLHEKLDKSVPHLTARHGIWDKVYFAETMGY